MPAADGTPAPRPLTWPDVVLQVAQSALTVAGALVLARWGLVSGELAAAAIGIGGAPALLRLVGRALPPKAPTGT